MQPPLQAEKHGVGVVSKHATPATKMAPRGLASASQSDGPPAAAARVQRRGLFFFPFAPFPSRLPRGSFCTGLRMLLESFSLRCCLHVFCRVEFPTSRSFPMRSAARGSPGHQACGGECCYSLSRSFYFRSTYVNRAAWGPFATVTRPSSAFS